jgi:transketolase
MTGASPDPKALARLIREETLRMVFRAQASHIGGSFSSAEILSVLYGRILRVDPGNPGWPDRDRFIMSKGHCCTALYAALALKGFFPLGELESYGRNGTRLMSHVSHHVPGVEWSTGSLGHGLPIACGQALAARRRGQGWRVFCLLSDGELDEGSNWEAFMFAAHHALDNLTAVVDRNGQQGLGRTSDVLRIDNLEERLKAFGWQAVAVDGHDVGRLEEALSAPGDGRPRAVIADTVKGKGVPFMEDRLEWHYRPPRNAEELEAALDALAREA